MRAVPHNLGGFGYITSPILPSPTSNFFPPHLSRQLSSCIFAPSLTQALPSNYPTPTTHIYSSSKMPSHTETLKNTLESKGLKFHLTTGNAKWQCTVLDRATQ